MQLFEFFTMGDKINELIENKTLKVDLNGHFEDSLFVNNKLPDSFILISHEILNLHSKLKEHSTEILELFYKILKQEPVEPFPLAILNNSKCCSVCGEPVVLWIDHERIFIKEKCKVDFKPVEVNIPVLSGKLVVENDLRYFFDVKESYDLVNFNGIKNTVELYANNLMFHGIVGDSDFSVKYSNDDKSSLVLANPENIDAKDIVTSVSTDLNWFSLVDLDVLKEQAKIMNINIDVNKLNIIDVKKGVYKCSNQFSSELYESDIFASMEWISEIPYNESVEIEEVDTKNSDAITEHHYLKLLENSSYSAIHPSLSVILWDAFITLETKKEKNNAFPYNYSNYPTGDKNEKGDDIYIGYMDVVNQNNTFLNILKDKSFFDSIPVFDKETFMLAKPESHFKYHTLSWYLNENTFPWAGAYYPHDIGIKDLIFILIQFKSMFEHKDSKAMEPYFTGEDTNPDFVIEKILFTLNMAYTNIVERGLKDSFYKNIEDLKKDSVWNKIKGYSEPLKESVLKEQEFNALRLISLGLLKKEDSKSWVETKVNQIFENWIVEKDPQEKNKEIRERLNKK